MACFVFCLSSRAEAEIKSESLSSQIQIGNNSFFEISNQVDYFKDQGAQFSIEQLASPDFNGFQKNEELYPSFGAFPGAIWLRFTLHNIRSESVESILALDAPVIDARLFVSNGANGFDEMNGGRKYTGDSESFPSRMPTFKLFFAPNEQKTFYLSMQSDLVYTVKLSVQRPDAFFQAERSANYFAGFYVGVMVIMILYNAFLFMATRDPSFLWYVVTVFFLHLTTMGSQVTNGDYFGVKNPIFPEYCVIYSKIIGTSAFLQFSRIFLRTNKSRSFDLVLKGLLVVNPIFLVLALVFPIPTVNAIQNLILIPGIVSLIVYSGILFSRGFRYARFYFIAWFPVILIGSVAVILNMSGNGHLFANAGYFLMVASMIEVLLLSMALGDKINELRIEKEHKDRLHKEEVLEMNRSLEDKIREKTRDIRTMLDNLKLGVFTVGADLSIGHDYSRHLERVLGSHALKSKALMPMLFEHAQVGADTIVQVETALHSSIGYEEIGFLGNEDHFIRQMSRKVGDQIQDLEVDWAPILDDNGLVDKMLVSVKDVTELNLLRRESDAHRRKIEIIEQCLSLEFSKFQELQRDLEHLIASANERALWLRESEQLEARKILLQKLFNAAHTAKAICRRYRLNHLADVIHGAEDYLHSVRDGKELLQKEKLTQIFATIDAVLKEYQACFELFTPLSASRSQTEVEQSIEQIISQGLEDRDSLAKELHKPVPTVNLIFEENPIPSEDWKKAISTLLIHFLRNSLDHGIETSEVRRNLGKSERGQISVRFLSRESHYRLEYTDDGAGLNLAKIRAKSLERGLISAVEFYSDSEIAKLIFASGLSTNDAVSHISGRGAGMDAVAQAIEALGGRIDLELGELNGGFRSVMFVAEIPRSGFQQEARKAG